MKILAKYKFTNNKTIQVVWLNPKDIKRLKVAKVDNFLLEFIDGKKTTGFGLRPDEVTQLIILLSYALWKATSAYTIGLFKGYNGFNLPK